MNKLLLSALLILCGTVAFAQTDHDNLDAGRPLRFEDAEPLAYRGLALELGLGANFSGDEEWFDLPIALVYGIALNQQLEVSISSLFGNVDNDGVDHIELAYMISFSREIRNSPAFAVKFGAEFPVVDDDDDPTYTARAIWTKTARQYDRLHLNLDVGFLPEAQSGEREVRFGAILGYTRPIGYFTHFDTTAVAELGFEQGELNGDRASVFGGLGIRRQINPRSVLDLGIEFDFERERNKTTRIVAGYSVSF
jgi:hypothetical protein